MSITTLKDLKESLGMSASSSLMDVKKLIDSFLDRKEIDLITRIRETELDRICNMLHHCHQISVKWNKALLIELRKHKDFKEQDYNPVVCTGEGYVLQNLSLRLSLNSESRKELENIFISLIKTELDLQKAKGGEVPKEKEAK